LSPGRWGEIRVKFQDLFLVSWRQIVRHRRRYWGVILAITIGIGGLITVIMVSRDFKRNLSRDLDLVGGVTIVRAYYDNSLSSRPLLFQANTLEALRRLPGVQDASLMGFHTGWTKTSNGKKFLFSVMAVDEAFWGVRGFWAASGRLFGPATVTGRKRECVLGQALAEKSFGHSNVVGQTLEINNEPYLVLGVLGGITDSSLAGSVFLPRTTVQDRFAGLLLTDRIYLRCATLDDVAPVAAKIVEVVRNYQTDQHLHVEVIWEGLKRVQQIFWWAEFFIYVAIGATLLLGGLGIWNVMMAAVRSRTRKLVCARPWAPMTPTSSSNFSPRR